MIERLRAVRLIVVLLPLVLAAFAFACRYTVRDIGFVRLTDPAYQLIVVGGSTDMAALRTAMKNLPLKVESVDPSHDPTHVAVLAARTSPQEAVLLDGAGRTLLVDDPMSIGHTPLARELSEDAASTFAFVILLKSDTPEDDAASKEVASLQRSLDAIEQHLPRPLGYPLRVIELDTEAQSRERALLWSLGVDLPVTEPTVLITYGRARRAGAPVAIAGAGRIDATRELLAQLALVGESCECDTSRAWTAEPVGLVPWSRTTHSQASGALGFDPESPMVRAEVVRILGKTADDRGTRSDRPETIEELLLGYAETSLEPITPAPGETASAVTDTRGNPAPPVRILSEGVGDDWSFDESTAKAETPPREEATGGRSGLLVTILMLCGLIGFSFIVGFAMIRRSGASA